MSSSISVASMGTIWSLLRLAVFFKGVHSLVALAYFKTWASDLHASGRGLTQHSYSLETSLQCHSILRRGYVCSHPPEARKAAKNQIVWDHLPVFSVDKQD